MDTRTAARVRLGQSTRPGRRGKATRSIACRFATRYDENRYEPPGLTRRARTAGINPAARGEKSPGTGVPIMTQTDEPVPLADLALARRLERAEGSGGARFVETRARLRPD